MPVFEIVSDVTEDAAKAFAEQMGYARYTADWHDVVSDPAVDLVDVATPNCMHYEMAKAALENGKHVFCEKSIGFTMEECYRMYQKHRSTGKIFFTGQQRLFDPRYIKAMEMIHAGTFGEINAIRTFWNRNGDWRRSVPSPNLERLINWRLYKEFSKGRNSLAINFRSEAGLCVRYPKR